MVTAWIAYDHETWLLEFLGVLVGKGTWGPLSTEEVGTGVLTELEDSSLGYISVGNNENVLGVVNGSDDSGGNHELFPGLGNIDAVNALLVSRVDVWFHLLGAVLSTEVHISGKHESEILIPSIRVCEAVGHL